MIVSVNGHDYHFHIRRHPDAGRPELLFLHGFTGSAESFGHVFDDLAKDFTLIAPDLPGHGKTGINDSGRFHFDRIVEDVSGMVDALELKDPVVFGYSMGARLGLGAIVRYPERFRAAVLEGVSAGITDEKERQARLDSDAGTARSIRQVFERFCIQWDGKDVFKSGRQIPEKLAKKMMEIRKDNIPEHLALALENYGTGTMPPLKSLVNGIECPVLLVCGSEDAKFRQIGAQLNKTIPKSTLAIMPGCGHRVHLEDADAYLHRVKKFLNQLTD